MPYTAHPVWIFRPNWDDGVLERLEWKTDVLASETAEEQRISRRPTPRRSFEASFMLQGRERQYFDVLMSAKGSSVFLIPIWHHISRTNAISMVGTNRVYLDPSYRGYKVGDTVMLVGGSFNQFEVQTITVVTPVYLQLSSNLESTWPSGSYVYPARLARVEMNQQASKKTDTFTTLTARFTVSEANPYISSGLVQTLYRGYPILDTHPDDSEDLTHEYQRLLYTQDNDIGIPFVYDYVTHGQQSNQYRWSFVGRVAHDNFKKLLYTLRGRAGAMWLPTFMSDFTPVANISGLTIDVQYIGYTDNGGILEGRQDIVIELHDGTKHYRRIVSSAVVGGIIERLTLDGSLPSITLASVARVSYVNLCRLDQDSVEIKHLTDSDGLMTCVVSWRGPVKFNSNSVTFLPPIQQPQVCYTGFFDNGYQVFNDLFRNGDFSTTVLPISNVTTPYGAGIQLVLQT